MRKLSKKKRHEYYIKAINDISASFICYKLQDASGIDSDLVLEYFPELLLFKPDVISNYGGWFNESNSDNYFILTDSNIHGRELILMFCIEMTA